MRWCPWHTQHSGVLLTAFVIALIITHIKGAGAAGPTGCGSEKPQIRKAQDLLLELSEAQE